LRRSVSQFAGTVVQFCVAWLPGTVHATKIANIAAMQAAAPSASQKRHGLRADDDRKDDVHHQCRHPQRPEHGPAAVDALHQKILRLAETDLVRKRRQVRARRDQRKRADRDGQELDDPRAHDHAMLHPGHSLRVGMCRTKAAAKAHRRAMVFSRD
jgi:hypothetical protein